MVPDPLPAGGIHLRPVGLDKHATDASNLLSNSLENFHFRAFDVNFQKVGRGELFLGHQVGDATNGTCISFSIR